jgi:hypothetical protein
MLEGETALGPIELSRRDADVEEDAVDHGKTERSEASRQIAEITMNKGDAAGQVGR